MTTLFPLHEENFNSESSSASKSLPTEWNGEVDRKNSNYIKWVQQSLNAIMGFRLAVDGRLGPKTRSTIRSFQQQHGLKVDGIVGAQTEQKIKAALKATSSTRATPSSRISPVTHIAETCMVLDRFDYARDQLKPAHIEKINAIAHQVVNRKETTQVIHNIRLIGHTDPVGSTADNLTLGRKRAQNVAQALRDAIERSALSSASSPTFTIESKGESQPISQDPALNRRVEVCIKNSAISSQPTSRGGSEPTSLDIRQQSGSGKPVQVKARILWPALGFPAVIAPRNKPSASPFVDGDATCCICVLVLSNQKYLSKEEAARYLRYVPWSHRGRRHIAAGQPGTFKEEELAVRHLDRQPPLLWKHPTDMHGELVVFGGDGDGRNGIVAKLATRVRKIIYKAEGLEFLHEIRVYEPATVRLTDGLYHLFWNNESIGEQSPSDEMSLLLRTFAHRRREKLGKIWQQYSHFLINEYEYEYGGIHLPYNKNAVGRGTRAEVLHPLFVQRDRSPILRIGHITDTHVDVRADVYEENLKNAEKELKLAKIPVPIPYNNWNRSFDRTYANAKAESDVVLITGDLIDYGRGYWWTEKDKRKTLADDKMYHEDRNWFLFYFLLASGNAYTCPVYTILGNHDWRLNPYTPFAIAGAPSPEALIHNSESYPSLKQYTPAQQKKMRKDMHEAILRAAHGKGHKRIISYVHEIEEKWELFRLRYLKGTVAQFFKTVFGNQQTADKEKYPTETKVESVEWYLLTINPFLDYWFTHPREHKILMLDWAEDENVFFQEITNGRKHGINFIWLFGGDPGGEGPKARNCLTDFQAEMVMKFAEDPGLSKVIGIHAPPIGPWADWYDDELRRGQKKYEPDKKPRGSLGFATKTSSIPTPDKAHPLFALRPPLQVSSDPVWGMDAVYGSFERNRDWFIKLLSNQRYGVRLVLSGHIHRNGLFAAYLAGKHRGPALEGRMLIQSQDAPAANGIRPPAVFRNPVSKTDTGLQFAPGPLYVNTTSAGPRGHLYASKTAQQYVAPGFAHIELVKDGTIKKVVFQNLNNEAPSNPIAPERELNFSHG